MHHNLSQAYIMIAGLPYLDADVREFVGVFFSSILSWGAGKDPTLLQYQTNQNHNKSYQLNPHKRMP